MCFTRNDNVSFFGYSPSDSVMIGFFINKIRACLCRVRTIYNIRDLDLLTIGMVNDMYAESSNDEYKGYAQNATQRDFDAFYQNLMCLL